MRITVAYRSDEPQGAEPAGAVSGGIVGRILSNYGARAGIAAEIAVQGLTEAIKQRARQRVRAGNFKSTKLPFVIRSNFYDNRNKPDKGGPTGIVASNWQTKSGGKDKLAPFVLGLTLKPLNAKRLIVPLKSGPGFAAMVRERLLQLGSDPTLGVARLPGGKLLVYDRRGGKKNLALALLVPSVKMPKRIDFSGVDANAAEELADRFNQAMDGSAAIKE